MGQVDHVPPFSLALCKQFTKFGHITGVIITGVIRGIVTFSTPEEARAAFEYLKRDGCNIELGVVQLGEWSFSAEHTVDGAELLEGESAGDEGAVSDDVLLM